MGIGKSLKKAFGKKKGRKQPKPKGAQTTDMFGMSFGLGANGGLVMGDTEYDSRTPILDEAGSQGIGGGSNVMTSMLQASGDLGYNLDNPMMPKWSEPTRPSGPGLGDAGRGLGFGRKGKAVGNELRRGPSVVQAGDADMQVNEAESAHTTHMMSFDDEIGLSGSDRGVFKFDPEQETAAAALQYNIGQEEGNSRMAARAVASSRLDRALGTNVLSEDTFAEKDGQMGVLSPLVEGQALGYGTEGKILDVDPENENFKRTMSDLQLVDYLTGQVDRHNANMFVGPDGSVKGIDNDMAFGTEDLFMTPATEEMGNHIKSMPKHVDQGTAERLLEMDEAQFLASISGRADDPQALNEDETGAALERFRKLREHVATLQEDGGLIEDWSAVQGDDDAFNSPTTNPGEGRGWGSYLDRTEGYRDRYKSPEKRVAHETSPKKKKKSTRKDLFA